jgi:hypothetical protein
MDGGSGLVFSIPTIKRGEVYFVVDQIVKGMLESAGE